MSIEAAEMPVAGISLSDESVMFNGQPLSQASSAEQLKVSVAMAFALKPRLKICLIRDGSLLDENSLKLVAGMAEEADAQVWLEKVSSDGAGCSVVIEDGMVKEK